ncbi:hypothetical protein [Virgibacillus kimchii]
MTKDEIKNELEALGIEFDEKMKKDELADLLEQEKQMKKTYVVIHDFKDLKDNDKIYVKDDVYPHEKVSDDRIEELKSSNNKIGKPLIKEQE